MATAIRLDDNGRIVEETSGTAGTDFATVDGVDEVAQSLLVRLRTNQGEDPYFPDGGLPIRDIIRVFDEEALSVVFREQTLREPGISAVFDLSAELTDKPGRVARITTDFVAVEGGRGRTAIEV